MSRISSHIQSAVSILKEYNGQEPFANYLKKFFASQKKYGSRDRKKISHLCYSYFRLGKAYPDLATEQRILHALFLCSTSPDEYLAELNPGLNERVSLPAEEKGIQADDIFPWVRELSESFNAEK